MPAKTEGVAEYHIHFLFARNIRNVIQIAVGIGSLVVNGGRQHLAAQRQAADDGLDGALTRALDRAQAVAHHGVADRLEAVGAQGAELLGIADPRGLGDAARLVMPAAAALRPPALAPRRAAAAAPGRARCRRCRA